MVDVIKARNMHHVPKVYLRNFTANEKEQVYTYSRQGDCFLTNISNICARKGLHDEETECLLNDLESNARPILDRVVQGNPEATARITDHGQLEVLSEFFGFMNSRNPYTIDELTRIHEVHCELLEGLAATGCELLDRYLLEVGLDVDSKECQKMLNVCSGNRLGSLVEKQVHEQWLEKLSEYGKKATGLLLEHDFWYIVSVRSERILTTSDNPAVVASLNAGPEDGTSGEEMVVHIPVSPKRTILVSDSPIKLGGEGLTDRQVRTLNSWQMHFAWKYVIASRKEGHIRENFVRTRDGALLELFREGNDIHEVQERYQHFAFNRGTS